MTVKNVQYKIHYLFFYKIKDKIDYLKQKLKTNEK